MNSLRLTLSVKVGIVLGGLHFLLVALVVLSLLTTELDAQWQLVWIPFLIADFPISLLIVVARLLIPVWHFSVGTYPVSELHGFLVPAVVHGIVGSLWWFLLPILFAKLWSKVRKRKDGGKTSAGI